MSTEFTPFASLIGGILIGLSAAIMLLANGKIAGISGIYGGLLKPQKNETAWRLTFVGGLVLGGVLFALLYPSALRMGLSRSAAVMVLAGLLVGFGSRTGNGCTSGHGVCGISRFSTRSIVATITFLSTGAITVFLFNHVFGANP